MGTPQNLALKGCKDVSGTPLEAPGGPWRPPGGPGPGGPGPWTPPPHKPPNPWLKAPANPPVGRSKEDDLFEVGIEGVALNPNRK